jgi:hypothetical protein
VLDGQDLGAAEAGGVRVLAQRVGAHDGPRGRGGLVDPPDGQAVQDAEPVEEAVQRVLGGRGEVLARALVGDDDAAALDEQPAGGAQRLHGAGHVVQGLEERHQVVGPGERVVGRVLAEEAHAAVQAGVPGVAPGLRDRRGVLVQAVHGGQRVRPGDGEARPAAAARQVRHARRRPRQAGVDLGHGGQPRRAQQLREQRPVRVGDALAHVGAVVGVRDPRSGHEGVEEAWQDRQRPEREPDHAGHRRQAVRVQERVGVAGRQPEAPGLGRRAGVVARQDARGGLLLEPFADVARIRGGPGGELGRGGRAALGERGVQAETVAEVDPGELQGADRRLEGLLQQAAGRVGVGLRGRGVGRGGDEEGHGGQGPGAASRDRPAARPACVPRPVRAATGAR